MTWNKESEEQSQYKEIFCLTEFAENKIYVKELEKVKNFYEVSRQI